MRYRFTWFGGRHIYVSPCHVNFASDSVFERDFDKFADFCKGPYCFPRGLSWETNLDDVLTFKLFKLKGLNTCVKSYHAAQVVPL